MDTGGRFYEVWGWPAFIQARQWLLVMYVHNEKTMVLTRGSRAATVVGAGHVCSAVKL